MVDKLLKELAIPTGFEPVTIGLEGRWLTRELQRVEPISFTVRDPQIIEEAWGDVK